MGGMEPSAVVVMKGGPHAGASWSAIVDWKRADLARAGVTLWGYGGTVCHPLTQVQPFARAHRLVEVGMIPTTSDPGNVATIAEAMSRDGTTWDPLPSGITVTGSAHALVLDRLEPCEETIDLGRYVVAIGPKAGTPASAYIRSRVDKACLRLADSSGPVDLRPVTLRGRLAEPWAVLLRGVATSASIERSDSAGQLDRRKSSFRQASSGVPAARPTAIAMFDTLMWNTAVAKQYVRVLEASSVEDRTIDLYLFAMAVRGVMTGATQALAVAAAYGLADAAGRVREAIAAFDEAVPDSKPVRDVLVHIDEYRAGNGRLQRAPKGGKGAAMGELFEWVERDPAGPVLVLAGRYRLPLPLAKAACDHLTDEVVAAMRVTGDGS